MAANMEKFATQLERDVLIALKEYAPPASAHSAGSKSSAYRKWVKVAWRRLW